MTGAGRGPTPDPARGPALLGIAIADSAVHISGVDLGVGRRPVDGSALDRVVNGIVPVLVDSRTPPMSALLLGVAHIPPLSFGDILLPCA